VFALPRTNQIKQVKRTDGQESKNKVDLLDLQWIREIEPADDPETF
jgi:hypothetical protein